MGIIFGSRVKLKNALTQYVVKQRRDLKVVKNDRVRVKIIYNDKNCGWKILVSVDGNTGDWMVKTYYGAHTCKWAFKNNRVTYKVMVEYFIKYKREGAISIK